MLTGTHGAITVVIADGNPLVLSALAEVFERDARFSLVATTATADGFLATAARVSVAVAVIDWAVPPVGGARLIEVLRGRPGAPRMVIYGDATGGTLPRYAMLAGAAGFAARAAPVDRLLEACVAVAQGQMVFPFLDVRSLHDDPATQLTPRERTLLEALSKGATNRTLATEFGISANTVKFHLSNLYEKLGLTSRAQAIAFYYSARLSDQAAGHMTHPTERNAR